MRVVLMGYQQWGEEVYRALAASCHEIVLVVTHPASDHAYENILGGEITGLAERDAVPVLTRFRADEEIRVAVERVEADIIVSADWRTWLASDICAAARYGAINIHDALLPRYGGFAPLNWAMLNGETNVGVTVHFMTPEFDLGDIVVQESVPVGPNDNVTDLFHKTVPLFGPLVLRALDQIGSGHSEWLRQDPSMATFFHKRTVEDSRMDWREPADYLHRLVRAQADPYPNAFAFRGKDRVRILETTVTDTPLGGTPGRIFRPVDDIGVAIVCGPRATTGTEKALVIRRLRDDDGREHTAREFFPTMGGYLRSWPTP